MVITNAHWLRADLVEARISVETATAKLAALRATAEQRRYLHRLAEQMDSTAKLEDFVGLDIAFHMTLAQASQNYVLGEIIRGIQQLMRSSMLRFCNPVRLANSVTSNTTAYVKRLTAMTQLKRSILW